jgi:hypothetical protein
VKSVKQSDQIGIGQVMALLASRWKITPTRMTVNNWMRRGRGLFILDSFVNTAGRRVTTVEAVEAFVEACTVEDLVTAKAGRPVVAETEANG